MTRSRTTTLTALAAAAALFAAATPAPADLIHRFDAAGAGNTSSEFNGANGVWNDELTDNFFELRNSLTRTPISGGWTSFTHAYATENNNNTGRGGLGKAPDNSDVSFAMGEDEAMVEIWFRRDLSTIFAESGTNNQLLWESGGPANGFSISLTADGTTGDPLARLRFSEGSTTKANFTLNLAGLDDSDFIQLTAILDEDGATDIATLIARSAASGQQLTASANISGSGINGSVAGGNPSGVFTSATNGALGSSPGGDLGSVVGYNGEIALINVYNMVDRGALEASFIDVVVPEPASGALLALAGAALLRRRRAA